MVCCLDLVPASGGMLKLALYDVVSASGSIVDLAHVAHCAHVWLC